MVPGSKSLCDRTLWDKYEQKKIPYFLLNFCSMEGGNPSLTSLQTPHFALIS